MTYSTTPAFDPTAVGGISVRNRIVMSPMTRSRAFGTRATPAMVTYYAQRAGAGLIITEGVQPSPVGQGYPDTPGLHSREQVESWRQVTDAVHDAGGAIVAQLMHAGRIGHPSTTAAAGNGPLTPVGPSAVAAAGQVFSPDGQRDHVVPHALTEDELIETIADFVAAARNAIAAGFDGVEIHAANGYLLHQFLAPNANQRTDRWGGSIENRIRLTLEVTAAVAEAIGADRVGVRISPANGLGDTVEPDHAAVYPLLVQKLNDYGLAYLHLIEAGATDLTPTLRSQWRGSLILNAAGADPLAHPERLQRLEAEADLLSFGRLFISNPDLVERLEAGAELSLPDLTKAYGGDHRGYTDYPVLARAAA